MLDIKARIDEAKARKIRISPVHSNRAGELGHPCLRYLVYQRTRWQDKLAHSIGLQYIFDQGNRIEAGMLDDLKDAGIRVIHQQKDLFWKEYNISGRIDGRIDDPPRQPPIEIKSISPFEFPRLNTIADFQNSKKVWLRKWPAQMMIYLLLEAEDQGYLILCNKLNGQIKPISIELDYDYAETLIKKAEEVNAHVELGTLPDRIEDEAVHENCPFYHICLPEAVNPDKMIMDPELESMIDRWAELKAVIASLEKEFKPMDDELKSTFKGKEAIVGNWLISGKKVHVHQNEQAAKDFDYWKMTVKPIVKKVIDEE